MKTSKAVSAISYNSPEFLRQQIDYWRRNGTIEFAIWIYHRAEEGEKKDHWHVYLRPAKQIQTMDLEKESFEFDPSHKLPLCTKGFNHSSVNDWLLYVLHDKDYLASKGLTRKFHYDISDLETTDFDVLADIITHLNDERKGRLETRIIDAVACGMSWQDVVRSGIIPLRYMGNARIMFYALTGGVDRKEEYASAENGLRNAAVNIEHKKKVLEAEEKVFGAFPF